MCQELSVLWELNVNNHFLGLLQMMKQIVDDTVILPGSQTLAAKPIFPNNLAPNLVCQATLLLCL